MKKIRKIYSGVVPNGKVLNSRNDSLQDTYSSDYLNRTIPDTNNLGEIVVDDITCKNKFGFYYSQSTLGISVNSTGSKITLNGTSTGAGNFIPTTFLRRLKAGTYTSKARRISGTQTTGSNAYAIYLRNSTGHLIYHELSSISENGSNTKTFTLTEDTDIYVNGYISGSGVVINNMVFTVQVEEGSASDYVEYKEFECTGLKGEIIWSNPNPSNAFEGQTVTLDKSINNFDMYKVFCKRLNSYTETLMFECPKGLACYMDYCVYASGSSTVLHNERTVTINGTDCVFSDATRNGATSNTNLIPLYVIGYKTGLFR